MRKSIKLYGLICLLVAVLLSGCGAKNEPQVQEGTPAEVEASAPVSSPEGEVAAILAKCKEIDSLSFEYATTDSEGNVEGKAWIKGGRSKNEMTIDGETIVSIFDFATSEAYLYIPKENMATLTNLDPDMVGWFEAPANYYDDVDAALVKIVGTETIAGFKCKIMSITDAQGKEESKMWVSEEYGIPLRVETYHEEGQTTMEYKNLKVGSVSDAELQLPENVEIADMRMLK